MCLCDTLRMKRSRMCIQAQQTRGFLNRQSPPDFIGAMDSPRASAAFSPRAIRGRIGKRSRHRLRLHQALLIKQAEFWLMLGEPSEALQQLKRLSEVARKDPWALKVRLAVLHSTLNRHGSEENQEYTV